MTNAQLRPLMALRWTMVRSRRARRGFLLLGLSLPVLCLGSIVTGLLAPEANRFDITLAAPTAFLSVAVLAVIAPLVAGGGNELFPQEQLATYPITTRTVYLASLVLTPLNLAWAAQLVGLLGLTAYISGTDRLLPLALVTTLTFIAFVTVAGQALAWLVVGLRQRSAGRRATGAVLLVVATSLVVVLVTGRVGAVLDESPTVTVVTAVAGPNLQLERMAVTIGLLLLLTWIADRLGRRSCGWALGRPGDAHAGRLQSQPVRRRRARPGQFSELLAIDRASVWRSPSLRRGLLVLGLLPGAVAAVAGLNWPSLVLLPGLVAAGAGLLFGVNAFCLDGSGAVWLTSLPGRPATAFWSKTRVVLETCTVATVLTVCAGGIRSGRLPTAAEVAAVASCAVVSLLRVLATCMDLSVTRPHRADLRGPRNTPAPPGVMAAYSARLAVSTTLVAVLFSVLADVAPWPWPVLVAVPFCLMSLRRLVRSAGQWQDASVRARVVTVVVSG